MDTSQQLPDEFVQLCQSVTAKRPKAVIDHILQYGFITTEDLKETYGYNHPPRAARDVRENGIPLETFRVTGSDGIEQNLGHVSIAKIGVVLKISPFAYHATGDIQKIMHILRCVKLGE